MQVFEVGLILFTGMWDSFFDILGFYGVIKEKIDFYRYVTSKIKIAEDIDLHLIYLFDNFVYLIRLNKG